MTDHRITVADALARLSARADGKRFVELMQHGTLSVEIYAPRGRDTQSPHTRDECYVVVHGHGEFINGSERYAFGPGDFLFVPAGVEHRFVDFSDDLVLWVIFYGPEGGEADILPPSK
jgi:mannose-6-phosphate isomerase-like protein (cupin superfamily)